MPVPLTRRLADGNNPASSLFAGLASSVKKRRQWGDPISASHPNFTQPDDVDFDDGDIDKKPEELLPSHSQLYEMFRPKYDPVRTADGFICARKPPRRRPLVSRPTPLSSAVECRLKMIARRVELV